MLRLQGTVTERFRKVSDKEGKVHTIITYHIKDDENRSFIVRDFDPAEYYAVMQEVDLPVYVSVYLKTNGGVAYSLNISKERLEENGQERF